MAFKGKITLPNPHIAFFLIGIAFLGSVSAPLQAADSAPSTWDKLFGGGAQETQTEQNKAKPKKSRAEKPAQKAQKGAKQTKSSASSADTSDTAKPNPAATSASNEQSVTTPTNNAEPNGLGVIFKGVFGGASSNSPFLEEAKQIDSPQNTSSNPLTSSTASPVATPITSTPATAPEAPKSEPFWKRMFGGASSQPPESKSETVQTTPATPSTVKELNPEPIQPPASANKPTPPNEEPSFWQRLFGGKSSPVTTSKSGGSSGKSSDKASEITPSTSTQNITTENNSIIVPTGLISASSTSETKADFGLVNVCEREKCELMIVYDAPINKSNVEKFMQSTASIPVGTAVLFNSMDGDLNSGIKLGQVLRQKRFNARIGRTKFIKKTLVETDGQCYSACVLAFAGGINRRIDPNDQLGIYALRPNSKSVNENEMRQAINGLNTYFDQMGIDRRLADQMLQVKGSAVSLISLSNSKLLNLDNSSRAITYPWRMQALDDGLIIALATEKQASGQFSITLGLTKQNRELRLTIYIKPLSGSPNLAQLSDFLNRNAQLQMSIANQTITPSLMKPWEPTASGVQTAVLLSEKEMNAITSTLEFELDITQINRNPFNLDSVTVFGTLGLKGALTAIRK